MKLYAKIEADKLQDGTHIVVSKAQGSNEYLQINITNDTGALIACVQVKARKGDIPAVYFVNDPAHGYLATSRVEYNAILSIEKGKK